MDQALLLLAAVSFVALVLALLSALLPNADYDRLTLGGHSMGGDITMYFAKPRHGASRVAHAFLVYMPSPLPRRSGWTSYFARSPSRISLPRKGGRVGLRIVLFEVCSAFTRVTACTLALSPIRDTLTEGFSHFVTSMTAPVASGWSGCRVGLTPTRKRRLPTAHTQVGHRATSGLC